MKLDTLKTILSEVLPFLAKHPFVSVSVLALAVPIFLIYGATQFVSASTESLFLFGFLCIATLAYSAWVVSFIKKFAKIEEKQNH